MYEIRYINPNGTRGEKVVDDNIDSIVKLLSKVGCSFITVNPL